MPWKVKTFNNIDKKLRYYIEMTRIVSMGMGSLYYLHCVCKYADYFEDNLGNKLYMLHDDVKKLNNNKKKLR